MEHTAASRTEIGTRFSAVSSLVYKLANVVLIVGAHHS